jgi:hypothetical protein
MLGIAAFLRDASARFNEVRALREEIGALKAGRRKVEGKPDDTA